MPAATTVSSTKKTGAAAPTDSYGAWGSAIAALIGAFGNKQSSAAAQPFTPVNPQEEQLKAIAGDTAAQPGIEELLTRSNAFQQGQANSMMESAVPGYGKLATSLTKDAQQQADHPYDLPPDVTANISRLAAERGVNVGTRGQTQSFSALRDLGVNMLDFGQKNLSSALTALSTITGTAPRVSPMSPMSFYVGPADQISNQQLTNAQDQYSRQAAANSSTAAKNANTSNTWGDLMQAISYGAQAYGDYAES